MLPHCTLPRGLLMLLLCLLAGVAAAAPIVRDLPPGLQIPAAAQPGPGFDVDRATEAYLNLLNPQQRALSDRYFEGGYWLQLWQLLWTLGSCALLLLSGVSRRLRDAAQRFTGRKWLSTALCGAGFLALLFLLQFPLSVYSDFLRERQYALTEQPFGGWLRDSLVNDAVMLVLGTLIITALYAAVRRSGRVWWAWATGLTFVFLMFFSLIVPPLIEPLFNDYKPLPAGPVREAVLSLARANQVPTGHVEWFDASKQTTRLSANVAGFLGTTRIALNDNLLNKSSLPEIKAVLGHEMGHYVLNHVWKEPVLLALLMGLSFLLLHFAMDATLEHWGRRLGLADRADPAALPLAMGLIALIFFLFTPLQNSIVRSYEAEADAFGLNAAREPQAWALAAMRLSTYRKLKPGAFEEFVFYDHPSGYERVHAAMVWLKENPAAAQTVPAALSP
jgi:STE24 endopeptidase